jgi:hypothetical protein
MTKDASPSELGSLISQESPARVDKFAFECPLNFFSKADAPGAKQRRIGGIISTDSIDQQNESILQNGLDFGHFLKNGWYNDNHSAKTCDILGYPESVTQFGKGDTLPDGSQAAAALTWAEGYLLGTPKADEIWQLGQALQDTGRHLGFSVEGDIVKRQADGRTIAKAKIRNVAITAVPVNMDCRLEVLARSLSAIEAQAAESEPERTDKAFTVSSAPLSQAAVPNPVNTVFDAPVSEQGAGAVLREQSFSDAKETKAEAKARKKKRVQAEKSLTNEQALQWVHDQLPDADENFARQFVLTARTLAARGLV